ncbi:MAG TPA: metalloregulator ArsR/SmtB family transcription factor [Solirubrobacter sp.]
MDQRAFDERLRALAHPVRRSLFAACLAEAQPAGALVEHTGLAAASVSEHLKVLRKTGLLVLESRGRFRLYTADPESVRETAGALTAWLDELQTPPSH